MKARVEKKRASGKIMIEFLLVAPVFLMISGGTIEVANFMRLSQISTVVSQEAANQAYRQCSSVVRLKNPADPRYSTAPGTPRIQIDDVSTPVAVQNCLENVRLNSLSTLNQLNQNTSDNAVHLMVARYYQRGTNTKFQSFEATTTTSLLPGSINQSDSGGNSEKRNSKEKDTGKNRSFDKKASCNSNGEVEYQSNSQRSITLIPTAELQRREQVIVGQAVAGYTPLVKFFNLKILYSGDFRAVTVM